MLNQSKQSADFSVFVNIDFFRRRNLGQAGHSHNITGQNYDKTCSCGDFDIFLNATGKHYIEAQLWSDRYISNIF